MLDRLVALAMGERDVEGGDVVLEINEGLAAPCGRYSPKVEDVARPDRLSNLAAALACVPENPPQRRLRHPLSSPSRGRRQAQGDPRRRRRSARAGAARPAERP